MDTILANSQANLAYRQRDLATQTKLQLPQNKNISGLEREQMDATEELNRVTRNNQFEVEKQRREISSTGAVDHISQLQKTQVQLRIAEKQVEVAERQLQLATAHVQNAMDPMNYNSQLSQQSDLRRAEEFRKKAVPLFSEATELLKQARHSVAFKEMGARQRMSSMGSFRSNQPYQNKSQTPPPPPYEPIGFETVSSHELDDSPYSRAVKPERDNAPIVENQKQYAAALSSSNTSVQINSFEPPKPTSHPLATTIQIPKQETKTKCCCCTPCVCVFIVLVIIILAAAGGFCAYWFAFKEKND